MSMSDLKECLEKGIPVASIDNVLGTVACVGQRLEDAGPGDQVALIHWDDGKRGYYTRKEIEKLVEVAR